MSSNFGDETLGVFVREPELSHIPPMERRRLNKNAKQLFGVLKDFELKNTPSVFCSSNGEINKCFSLLNELSKNEPISPTLFSLSVHNATIALYSIFAKNCGEISAISSTNSLEYAIIDAYLMLDEEVSEVLVVSHFEGISQSFYEDEPHGFVVAMLIEKGMDFSLQICENQAKEEPTKHSALDFLSHLVKNHKNWEVNEPNLKWKWTNAKG